MDAPGESTETSLLSLLTPRERQICRLLAYGYTNRQVAEQLKISERTVETHRANLTAKAGLRGRADIVQFALKSRLLRYE
jgi:two-component system response regulator NreC